MNPKRWLLAALALVALTVIVGGRLLWQEAAPAAPEVATAPAGADAPRPSMQLPTMVTPAMPVATTDVPLPPVAESTVDAADSMREALQHGDPQAPAVVRDAPREAASAAELADPKAYQRYEARQNLRLYNQYLKATDSEIPRLQADIERARQGGLSPEQIAEGEEKLRRIQAMRDQLQAAHPEAAAAP